MSTLSSKHRRLVLRVNELFHDLEGKQYDDVHPEIFTVERQRWDRLARSFLLSIPSPRSILDIGAGTGFVGERLLPLLRKGDRLICADISAQMLQVCREKLLQVRSDITLELLKMENERLDLPDASVDVVTMNSVLHHVPDTALFLAEIERVLRPGGMLFIGHEPNNRFYRSTFLRLQYQWLHRLAPKRIAASLLRFLGLYGAVVGTKQDPLIDRLNAQLLQEKLIDRPLARADYSPYIDVHSPTAGGMRKHEGFDPFTLLADRWTVKRIETYSPLSKLSGKHITLRPYEWLLRHLLPGSGATFFLVAQKNPQP